VKRFYVSKVKGQLSLAAKNAYKGKPGYTGAVGLGHSRISVDYVISNLERFYKNETRTMLQALEKVADYDQHETVDGPYCVLQISAKGATWEEAGKCSPN